MGRNSFVYGVTEVQTLVEASMNDPSPRNGSIPRTGDQRRRVIRVDQMDRVCLPVRSIALIGLPVLTTRSWQRRREFRIR
jgi:hypothetical protein